MGTEPVSVRRGASEAAPFADVKVAVDKTPAWEKRDAYSQTEVHWLERCSEGPTLTIILLGAHAGLRVSEITALRWDDVNLGEGTLKVVVGKGGKTAKVYLTSTLTQALELTPPRTTQWLRLAVSLPAGGVQPARVGV